VINDMALMSGLFEAVDGVRLIGFADCFNKKSSKNQEGRDYFDVLWEIFQMRRRLRFWSDE
jgi:hypothetical protein